MGKLIARQSTEVATLADAKKAKARSIAHGQMAKYHQLQQESEAAHEHAVNRLDCRRSLGTWFRKIEKQKGGRPKTGERSFTSFQQACDELGVTPRLAMYWQEESAISQADFVQYCDDMKTAGKLPTDEGLRGAGKPPISRNTSNDEWYTPPKYLESARNAMGSIDLDPASSKAANVRVKASWFYTPEENGLEQTWSGNVWLNPPFSQLLPFSEKLTTEATEGDVKQAVMLGPNFSDSAWWQLCAQHAAAVCHTNHRIRFVSSATDEVSKDSPTNGHTFFYFGGNIDRFDREFSQWGIVR